MNQPTLKIGKVTTILRSRRFVLGSIFILPILCLSQPALAHSGHSHQRTSSPSPTPEISNTETMEQTQNLKTSQPISTPSLEESSVNDKISQSSSTIHFISLMGEGLFFLIFIVPIAMTWLKRKHYQS